jgi:hypothetical protein
MQSGGKAPFANLPGNVLKILNRKPIKGRGVETYLGVYTIFQKFREIRFIQHGERYVDLDFT